jgi:hypothetical protein
MTVSGARGGAGRRRRFGFWAFASVFALLCLWPIACGSTPNTPSPVDASGAVDRPILTDAPSHPDLALDALGAECKLPTNLNDSVAGKCVPKRAFVTCSYQGSSSSYLADDPMGCLDCAGTCDDSCSLSEFALSCGIPVSDAGAKPSDPTFGCRVALVSPSGPVTYCCSCQ